MRGEGPQERGPVEVRGERLTGDTPECREARIPAADLSVRDRAVAVPRRPSCSTTPLPRAPSRPLWRVTTQRSWVTGFVAWTLTTSACAVIVSPMYTGAVNFQFWLRKTEPGPGRSIATSA